MAAATPASKTAAPKAMPAHAPRRARDQVLPSGASYGRERNRGHTGYPIHTDSYLFTERHLTKKKAPAEHYEHDFELRPDTTLHQNCARRRGNRGWPHLASVHAASPRPAALAWRSAGVASAMHGH